MNDVEPKFKRRINKGKNSKVNLTNVTGEINRKSITLSQHRDIKSKAEEIV